MNPVEILHVEIAITICALILGILLLFSTPKAKGPVTKAREGARVWNTWEHKGWGDALNIDGKGKDATELKVYGHLTPLPREGDIFRCRMQSGKTAKYIFVEVRPCMDPPDMFFGKVAYGEYDEG